jgi:hypothetical protein
VFEGCRRWHNSQLVAGMALEVSLRRGSVDGEQLAG